MCFALNQAESVLRRAESGEKVNLKRGRGKTGLTSADDLEAKHLALAAQETKALQWTGDKTIQITQPPELTSSVALQIVGLDATVNRSENTVKVEKKEKPAPEATPQPEKKENQEEENKNTNEDAAEAGDHKIPPSLKHTITHSLTDSHIHINTKHCTRHQPPQPYTIATAENPDK